MRANHSAHTDVNPHDPKSYPKDLDISSLIETILHEHPAHEKGERKGGRPWSKNDGSFEPSERGQESYPSPDTESLQMDAPLLQRWKDEPAIQGPYHGIDGVVVGIQAKQETRISPAPV